MKFLTYPIEIWIAVSVAIIVKLQTSNRLTLLGIVSTVFISMASALVLYDPICDMMNWGQDMHVIIAVIIALTSENLMKAIVEFTADRKVLKGVIKHLVKD